MITNWHSIVCIYVKLCSFSGLISANGKESWVGVDAASWLYKTERLPSSRRQLWTRCPFLVEAWGISPSSINFFPRLKQEFWLAVAGHVTFFNQSGSSIPGSFATNPQFFINLSDPDPFDAEKNCPVVISLLQQQEKRKSENAIGFKIYKCDLTDRSLDQAFFARTPPVRNMTS